MDHRLHRAIISSWRCALAYTHSPSSASSSERSHGRQRSARLAHHQHPALHGRRLGRRGHRMQAHHLGARAQRGLDRALLDRGDVQPQLPRLATGRHPHVVVDQRRGHPDRGREQQHVGLVEQRLGRIGVGVAGIVAEHAQAQVGGEEAAQPASVSAGAADNADGGGWFHASGGPRARSGRDTFRSRNAARPLRGNRPRYLCGRGARSIDRAITRPEPAMQSFDIVSEVDTELIAPSTEKPRAVSNFDFKGVDASSCEDAVIRSPRPPSSSCSR